MWTFAKKSWFALKRLWLIEPSDPDLRDVPEHKKDIDFAHQFMPPADEPDAPPGSGPDYGWVKEQAKAHYADLRRTLEVLDDKADAIIRYLGGGTAIITLGALATVNRTNFWLVWLLLPSIVLALVAIFEATLARSPKVAPMPPPIRSNIRMVNDLGSRSEDVFLGMWHVVCEGLKILIDQKAIHVTSAARYYYRSLLCLLLPLLVWPLCWWLMPAPPSKVEVIAPATKIELSVPQPQIRITR